MCVSIQMNRVGETETSTLQQVYLNTVVIEGAFLWLKPNTNHFLLYVIITKVPTPIFICKEINYKHWYYVNLYRN
jgi:hypothetical protein